MADLGKSNISWRDCILVVILALVAYLLYSLSNVHEKLITIESLLNEPIETEFVFE